MCRLPYSQDQCGNFLDNLENIDDTDREGDDEEVYFVPDTLDPEDDADDDNEYLYKPEDLDDIDAAFLATNPGPQQQEAWLHLDNVSTITKHVSDVSCCLEWRGLAKDLHWIGSCAN